MRRSVLLMLALSAVSCTPGTMGYVVKPDYFQLRHSFTGTWDSEWGEMQLKQRGTYVAGSYTRFNGVKGTINGKLEGNLLRFSWEEKGDLTSGQLTRRGRGFFNLSRDGKKLKGRWGYEKSMVDGGTWEAKRSIKYEE
ncbi:MAG: hypothetical protein KC609_04675 [Myxococcales bacterium]|nr:hypothetical protein [Myxococcales bacterium]